MARCYYLTPKSHIRLHFTQVSPALPDTIEGTGALVDGCGHNKFPLNAPVPPFPLARERLKFSTLTPDITL